MNEIGDVEYEHDGTVWTLPGHLVALQLEWVRADAACRAAVEAGDDAALARARAARLALTVEKFRRAAPWRESFNNHERWRADWALKEYAAGQLRAAAAE